MSIIAASSPSRKSINLFDALVLFVTTTSAVAITLLAFNHFNSVYALWGGLFLTLVCLRLFNTKIVIADQRFDIYLALILVIGFLFMSKPYLYIMGGQDQGLYVSMSSTYERTGSTFIKDSLREQLEEPAKSVYDEHNFWTKAVKKAGAYEGIHLPGIYIKDLAQSEYVYQFYPLHPLWMAIFGKLLGSDNRVYSIVFFALLSIVTFYLLAYELSGRKKAAGYLIALFLAINPLFTFFSKFPVSEMVMVAFSSLGLYYLLRYYRSTKEGEHAGWTLFLSSLSFFCLFTTHISGFLWIPFFYLILLLSLVFAEGAPRFRLSIFALSVLLGYALSVWYGLVYSFPYSNDLYDTELASRLVLFNWNWKWQLALALSAMVISPFIIYRFRDPIRRWSYRFYAHFFNLTSLAIALLIPLNIYKMYELKPELNYYLFSSTTYAAILYLTPFGFLLFLGAINHYRKSLDIRIFLFLLMLLLFWTTKVLIPAESGYQYYSSRYIFNEVVVYSLLIIAVYAAHLLEGGKIKQWLSVLLIGALSIYSLYFTTYQLQGQEADGANQALKQVASYVYDKDLLLTISLNQEVLTPLNYYFALPTFAIDRQSLQDETFVTSLLDQFSDVLVVSPEPLLYDKNLELLNIISYKEGIFEHPVGRIPTEFFYHNEMSLYLYKISRSDYFTTNKIIRPKNYTLAHFYSDSYWTDGNGIISGLKVPLHPENKYIILKTGGHNPIRGDMSRLNLQLFVNDQELKFNKMTDSDYYFDVDPAIKEINEIRIVSSTFIPSEFGINDDARPLGVDVEYILIK